MISSKFQKYIQQISTLADRYCGADYSRKINAFRAERERILSNVWQKKLVPEEIGEPGKDRVFRDIDFDTIVHFAKKYAEDPQYLRFLYEVSEISIRFGELERGDRLLRYLVSSRKVGKDTAFLAKVQQNLGNVAFYRNEYGSAVKYYQKSLGLYSDLGDLKGIACLKNAIGATHVEQGKLGDGEKLFKEARDIATMENYGEYLSKTNMNLGNIYHMNGKFDDSIQCYQKALEVVQENGGQADAIAPIYNNIALAYKSKGEYGKALEYLDKSLSLSKETNDLYTKAFSYLFQSEIYCYQKDHSRSMALVTSAFSIFSEIGDRLSMAEAYKILGMVNRDSKRYDIAESYFENSIRINERYNNLLNLAEAQIELSRLYQVTGDKSKTKKYLQQPLKIYQKMEAHNRAESVAKDLEKLQ